MVIRFRDPGDETDYEEENKEETGEGSPSDTETNQP